MIRGYRQRARSIFFSASRISFGSARFITRGRHRAAEELRIPKAYGSYQELLADPEIEAVYNPLPNHLHVPWSAASAVASAQETNPASYWSPPRVHRGLIEAGSTLSRS